jgi:hypothetical protein
MQPRILVSIVFIAVLLSAAMATGVANPVALESNQFRQKIDWWRLVMPVLHRSKV